MREELLHLGAWRGLEVRMLRRHQRAQEPRLQPRVTPVRAHEDETGAGVGEGHLG